MNNVVAIQYNRCMTLDDLTSDRYVELLEIVNNISWKVNLFIRPIGKFKQSDSGRLHEEYSVVVLVSNHWAEQRSYDGVCVCVCACACMRVWCSAESHDGLLSKFKVQGVYVCVCI